MACKSSLWTHATITATQGTSLRNIHQADGCAAGGGVLSERWGGKGTHAGAAAPAQLRAQALCAGAIRAAGGRAGRAPAALGAPALVWEAPPAALWTPWIPRWCWLCHSSGMHLISGSECSFAAPTHRLVAIAMSSAAPSALEECYTHKTHRSRHDADSLLQSAEKPGPFPPDDELAGTWEALSLDEGGQALLERRDVWGFSDAPNGEPPRNRGLRFG